MFELANGIGDKMYLQTNLVEQSFVLPSQPILYRIRQIPPKKRNKNRLKMNNVLAKYNIHLAGSEYLRSSVRTVNSMSVSNA